MLQPVISTVPATAVSSQAFGCTRTAMPRPLRSHFLSLPDVARHPTTKGRRALLCRAQRHSPGDGPTDPARYLTAQQHLSSSQHLSGAVPLLPEPVKYYPKQGAGDLCPGMGSHVCDESSSLPCTGHSLFCPPQQQTHSWRRWWHLCENAFKKGKNTARP